MSELRAATRQSTARTGIIEFDGARSTVSIPCTIADVSGTGARLKLDWSLAFPKEATLIFADGLRKACRVAWQKRRLLGVAFADGVASADEQALMMTEEEQALHRCHIGAQVKAAREARGYTEAQIANLVGVSPEFVASAERGEISIPLHQLTHMADLFLVDLDSLVAGPTLIALPPAELHPYESVDALLR
ncbi:helix-turn-helix transcriptional regulator [Bradyrhizobium sp. INPA01-394B]|uniref:Helix-turn-helix transcriptional regulator n=1 Tax=Bradyrhizobium campsiandrae TaxID=1729892 RepID=A0ABR7U4J6_9BRAD|nr:helix-turn-helix transcriptional regulator [Bradyrhizobium campsiandrae]MBC9881345.1 helix-turn-helix transcriptional regulator [Bradyrhizobium campsiandrae]MBC9978493.1 helix-turn-helix transcriptional regulator [Bradyrhizobium campsiandrae]